MIWYQVFGHPVGFKLEFLNPTGSYKDRGSAVLLSFLRSRRVTQAVEDSSGNAGASFAAYAAACGVQGRVYVPDYASGPKLAQIAAYGAEVYQVAGTRTQTTEAALKAVKHDVAYASHAFMPFGLAGYATLAYELYQQTGESAGHGHHPGRAGRLAAGHRTRLCRFAAGRADRKRCPKSSASRRWPARRSGRSSPTVRMG